MVGKIPDMIWMRRTFTDAAGRGGRFWRRISEALKTASKTSNQRIPTAEVDVKPCHPTMAFAAAGLIGIVNTTEIYDLG